MKSVLGEGFLPKRGWKLPVLGVAPPFLSQMSRRWKLFAQRLPTCAAPETSIVVVLYRQQQQILLFDY